MNILKSILACGLAWTAVSFADDRDENICNELGNDIVSLKLAYVDELKWYGDKSLAAADSQKVIRHESFENMAAIGKDFPYSIPYSLKAGCIVSKQVTYSFMQWDNSNKKWDVNGDNHDYATTIVDIHGNRTDTFDSTNAYNLLLVLAKNADFDKESYSSDELFVSKTYELAFESWFATANVYVSKDTVINGQTYGLRRTYSGYAMAQDSLKVVTNAVQSVKIPEGVNKVELQVFHAIMKDPNRKIPAAESSSSVEPVVTSSSSVTPVVESSSSVAPAESSSSEVSEPPLMVKSLQTTPAILGVRQVRRLDGSVVKSNETMKPGVYYVQGMDGLWKKQLVKTR